jgi:hypothetical protein
MVRFAIALALPLPVARAGDSYLMIDAQEIIARFYTSSPPGHNQHQDGVLIASVRGNRFASGRFTADLTL